MSVVGRAYVTVRAVTRQVEPDIQKGVDDALDRVSAKVSSDNGSGTKVGKSIGDGIEKSDPGARVIKSIEGSKDHTDRAGRDIGQSIGDGIFKSPSMKIAARIQGLVSKAIPDINSEGKKGGDAFGVGFVTGVGGFLGKALLNPIAAIAVAVPPALTQGLTLVSALSAEAVAAVGSLGPAVAAAGATGALAMGTLLTSIGAVTLAFKTTGPELDLLKQRFRPIMDDIQGIGRSIQRDLFPVLESAGARVDASLGATLQHGLLQTTDAIGGITNRLANLTEQPFFKADIRNILESNSVSLSRFGAAGVNGIGILADIASAAAPAVERIGRAIKGLSEDLLDSTRAGARSGGLSDFFDRAVTTSFQWGRILGGVGGALHSIFHIGSAESGGLLNRLESVTDAFHKWSDSAQGRNSIGQWFAQAQPVMSATGRLIGAVGRSLGEMSGGASGVVHTLNAISSAMPVVARVINTLSTDFGHLVGAIAPAAGQLIDRVAPALAGISKNLTDSLGPALDQIVGPLSSVLIAIGSFGDNLAPLITVAGAVLGPALTIVSDALTGINAALDLLPGPIGTLVLSLLGLRIAFGQVLGSARFGPMVAGITTSYAAIRAQNVGLELSFAGLRAAFQVTMDTLGGPLGIALAVASVAFGIFSSRSSDAASKQADLDAKIQGVTDTLNKNTGAITSNTRAYVGDQLQKDGTLDLLEKIGVSTSDYTNAILGNQGAIVRTNAALDAYHNNIGAITTAYGPYVAAQAQTDYDTLRNKFGYYSDEIAEGKTRVQQLGRANATTADSTSNLAQKVRLSAAAALSATGAYRQYHGVITAVNDAAVKGLQGQIGFRQAISDAEKKFKTSAATLSLYTQAGRDNTTALLGIATAAEQVTGSADKQQKAMKEARQEVIDLATAKTGDADAADKLASKIFDLSKGYDNLGKKKPKPDVESPSLTTQINNVRKLGTMLDDLNGRVFTFAVGPEGTPAPSISPTIPSHPVASGPRAGVHVGATGVAPRAEAPGRGDVNFNGPVHISTPDANGLMTDLEHRRRRAGLAGYQN